MARSPENKIGKALELEKIQALKAIETLNNECEAEVSRIISDQTKRGFFRSGITASRISKAYLSRAKKIIDKKIEL